ncbi:MAG: hypothetical protein ABIO65_11990 [Nitrospiria bacterium]
MGIGLVALLILGATVQAGPANIVWRTQTISFEAYDATTVQPGFALAPDGRAFAAWSHQGRMMFAELYLGVWQAPVELNATQAWGPSLATDAAGNPHIAYYTSNGSAVLHAWREGGVWRFDLVDRTTGFYSDIEVDSQGRVHVVYSKLSPPPSQIRYALKDASGWHVESLSTNGSSTYATDIAIGPDDTPHITQDAYTNPTITRTIHHWKPAGSGWMSELVDYWCAESGIDVDDLGGLHVSCNDGGGHVLYYHKQGSSWIREVIDGGTPPFLNGIPAQYTSIAVGEDRLPHLAYAWRSCGVTVYCNHVRYSAKQTEGSWISTFVDPEGRLDGGPTIRIDDWGVPRMAYYYYQDAVTGGGLFSNDLRYAEPLAAVPGGVACIVC